MRYNIYIFLLLFIVSSIFAQADFNKIHALKNVSIKKVYSENVNDSFYVYVKLPDGYEESTKNYPVLYVMDGDLIFPIACGVKHYLVTGEYVPELIIVGIGYGTMDWRMGNGRSRDYTAHPSPGIAFEGGAPEYLKFITNELIPSIDKNYRTKTNERIIVGHSLGGQFVIYSLLNSPQTFSKYIASSPFIFRQKHYYHKTAAEKFDEISKYNNKVFISVGKNELEEEYLNTIGDFVHQLRKNINTEIDFRIISDGEHFLNPAIALTFGLKSVFEIK